MFVLFYLNKIGKWTMFLLSAVIFASVWTDEVYWHLQSKNSIRKSSLTYFATKYLLKQGEFASPHPFSPSHPDPHSST